VFGRVFSDSGYVVLQLMSAAALLSVPVTYLNFAVVTAYQKTIHTMIAYAVGAVGAVCFYAISVSEFGLVGVGIAYLLVQLLMLGLSVFLARRVAGVSFPTRSYLIALCALGVAFSGSLAWPGTSVMHSVFKVGMVSVFVLLAATFKLMTPHEFLDLVKTVAPWRTRGTAP
jgi:O-antigen/teichoic acid export membrane protein